MAFYLMFGGGLLLIFAQTVSAQELRRGETVARVEIPNTNGQSFAYYLPTNFDSAKKYPTVYCFDPLARGAVAVERFRASAEQYGYIIIASNDSQNGLDGRRLSEIVAHLWSETHKTFPIDEKRVYTAGFSGGARTAVNFAFACRGCVFGVIGSGAGFPSGLSASAKMPFVYFGAVGFDDYNYPEMRELGEKLEKAQNIYRLETFDGRHQWLDEATAKEAFAWFEHLAILSGRRSADAKFSEDFFQTQTRRAERFQAENDYLQAFQTVRRLTADFGVLRDVSKYEKLLQNLQNSRELETARQEEEKQFRRQREIAAELVRLGRGLLVSELREDNLRQIRRTVESLRKKSDAPADSAERRVARRALNHVFAETFESAVFRYEREGDLETAAVNLELATEIYPQAAQAWYERARIYALQGKKKRALEMLEKAVELGIRSRARLNAEKSFESLRKTKEFQTLLENLK